MLKNNTKRQSGFTIIEVLIVLAIAGLILLIVFLAVPALQRNSRNTQAKNAAAAILAAVNEFGNNNNGQTPTGPATPIAADGSISITGAAGTTQSTGKTQAGYSATYGAAMPAASGAYVINVGHKCVGNTFDATNAPRAVSVGYNVETGAAAPNNLATQCVES
jgi:prepilin-type N-terminal cleavage/methylation domain-containing protein